MISRNFTVLNRLKIWRRSTDESRRMVERWYIDDDIRMMIIFFTGQLWMNFVNCSVTIVNKDIWSDNILNWPFRCLLYSMVIQVPFKCFQVFTIEFVKWRHGEVTTKLYCVALCRILFSKCLSTAMWSHFPQFWRLLCLLYFSHDYSWFCFL